MRQFTLLIGALLLLAACQTATKEIDLEQEFADRCGSRGYVSRDTGIQEMRRGRTADPPRQALGRRGLLEAHAFARHSGDDRRRDDTGFSM
jgi:hypothetical protein